MKSIIKTTLIGIIFTANLFLIGCGYTFVNVKAQLPPDIKKVYIPSFVNLTDEPNMGIIMANALTRELLKSGALVPCKKENADADLIGTVESVKYYNRIYNEEDRAVLITVGVKASLKLVKNGAVLWEVSNISDSNDYTIGSGVVMLDTNKESALQDLAEKLALEFHDRLIFGY